MKNDVFVIAAKRSPVGKFGGCFSAVDATDLGAKVVMELLRPFGLLKNKVNEVIVGNVLSAGLGQNPARIVAMKGGLPASVPAFSVNKVCGSGLQSVILATQSIQSGDQELVLAGGIESMSRCPYYLDDLRFGSRIGSKTIRDGMIVDGLFCSFINAHMGITGEILADKFKISRKQQDAFAYNSHAKAIRAIANNRFVEEIAPINGISIDEQPRKNTSLEVLGSLAPVFKKNGTVTAGNASPLNDGAAMTLIGSADFVAKNQLEALACIRSYSAIGLQPKLQGLGSYFAAKKCVQRAGISLSDVDLWEINEAFASQTLAVIDQLGIDPERVNVNGGAIAIGHPLGASGARTLTTLVHEMKKQKSRFGVVSVCIGGGQGVAMLVENI